jgi:flagellar hook-associated protein 1
MSIGSLLNISRRALDAQSTSISVVGNNIANVNTKGYTRQRADLVATSGANVSKTNPGTGVEVARIIRMADEFINRDLVNRTGDRSKAEVKSEFLRRAESPFGIEGQPGTISFQLNAFFSSLEDLQANPSDIPLRTQVLQKGSDLVFAVNETYNSVSRLQREADQRLNVVVSEVNRLTNGIAELNAQISKSERPEQQALNLRDQRDNLLLELGQLISFNTVESSRGEVDVYLSSGFSLVRGSSNQEIEVTFAPSFAPAPGYPPGLDGNGLSHIVYDYGGGSHVDLTSMIKGGGGELAGLLELRGTQSTADTNAFDADGQLVDIASHIEVIARDLLLRFNLEYLGPDEDGGTPGHQPSSFDLNGNSPIPFGLFSFRGANAGNSFGDLDNDGIPSINDLNALIATSQVGTFAGNLTFAVSSERSLAAARDLDPDPGVTSWASGDASNITGLLSQRGTILNYSLGNFNATSTIDGVYSLAVSSAGGKAARARDDLDIFRSRETQIRELQQSFSGVNLDEEFAKLIQFQRAFQGAAKLIRIGDDLTTDLLNLI